MTYQLALDSNYKLCVSVWSMCNRDLFHYWPEHGIFIA